MIQINDQNRYNFLLLGITILLLCIGLIMVYSASHHIALKKFEDGSLFFRKHFYRVLAGLVVLLITAFIPYKKWLMLAKLWILLGIGLLVAVLFIGEGDTAQRWIRIAGIRFQPVDFVRIALICYLANAMVKNRDYFDHWKEGLLPQLIVLGIVALLLLKQPDMGSAVILIIISMVIFITAGVRLRHLLLLSIPAIIGMLLFFIRSYQYQRIIAFINSVFHGMPLTYQIKQSLISLGNGGVFGKGLDNSSQKLEFLPEPFTDFIFAIVGEEFGFFGSLILMTLFLILVMEGYRIAHKCEDESGAILATGITTSLALYAFLNAGVVCNLFPTKGLPMPFISYGGSFMITTLAGIGILLNISQHNEFRLAGANSRTKKVSSKRVKMKRRKLGFSN